MSRLRIYVQGKPDWSDNEEGYAPRKAGHGGIASGFWAGVITARDKRDAAPRKKLPRQPFAELRDANRREGVA